MNINIIFVNKKRVLYYVLWIIIFISGIILLSIGINHESIWCDEGHTYAMLKNSFSDIIKYSSSDYHPPLYFILLKIFINIFGNTITSLRVFSLLGTISLMCLSIGPVRRIIGRKGSIVFMILIIIFPIFFSVSHDARMYTWACFFVTAGVLYGYLIVKENRFSDWIFFIIFTLSSCFIHHYALIAVVMLNIFLFFYFIFFDKKKIIPYLIIAIFMIILFIPWLFSLLFQLKQVSKDFWIPKPDGITIFNTLTFLTSDKFTSRTNIITVLFYLLLIVIVLYYAIKINIIDNNKNFLLFIISIFVYTLTFISVLIFSKYVKPIFYPRYILTISGLILIIIAYTLSRMNDTRLIVIFLLFLLFIMLPENLLVRNLRYNGPMREVADYLKLIVKNDDIFLHADEHTMCTFMYHFPENKHYLYLKSGFKGYMNYEAFGKNLTVINELNAIFLKSKKIWITNRVYSKTRIYKSFVYENNYEISETKIFSIPDSFYIIEFYSAVKK